MGQVRRQYLLLARVVWDIIKGIHGFHSVGGCVTVFGSARLTDERAPLYQAARALGVLLGRNDMTIMTGGGPGLMEAVCKGVREAGGRCIGCRIRLSLKQAENRYLDRWVTFRYFFVRKVMLLRHSRALVVLPGGLGTLDELFEVLTLVQTKRIVPLPIAFLGKDYWQPLLDVLQQMVATGTISASEMSHVMSHVLVSDSVDEVLQHLKTNSAQLPKSSGTVLFGAQSSSGDHSESTTAISA
jgi:hypothetical protein